jgi:hypothetical protein
VVSVSKKYEKVKHGANPYETSGRNFAGENRREVKC